ncbi:MAG: DUF3667 domain-containing protein [Inhella sp.]
MDLRYRGELMSGHRNTHCPNCGHRFNVLDRFCAQCGQTVVLHQPRFWEFVHEFINHYVALEGALWFSIKQLLLRPGQLTADYLAGRRARQVLPLRLFLTCSLLFFVVLGVLGTTIPIDPVRAKDPAAAAFDAAALAWAPKAVLLALPIYAALLAAVFRSSRRAYGEHFVFALHLHAFWFLAATVGLALNKLPQSWILIESLPWLAIVIYQPIALRRLHGCSWWGAVSRSVLLTLLHWLVVLIWVLIPVTIQQLPSRH